MVLYEAEGRLGGHAHTRDVGWRGRTIAVDTGFIVYNEPTYPNLTALFAHIGVETAPTDMSFSVSLDVAPMNMPARSLRGLLAQPANAFKPRFWSMIRDLLRFYREAPRDLASPRRHQPRRVSGARPAMARHSSRDHLYPMAAAIWSTPAAEIGAFPAAAFIRFCDNHGLLKLVGPAGLAHRARRLARLCPERSRRLGGHSRRGAPVCASRAGADGPSKCATRAAGSTVSTRS